LAEGLRYLKNHPDTASAFAQTAYRELKRNYTLFHYTARVNAVIDAVLR
jgi:spore maturation protein CgeB